MPTLLNHLNLSKNEIRNAVVQVLSADPSSPVTGQIYYNSSTGKLRQYNGSAWVEYGTGAGSGDVSGPSSSVDSELALFNSTTGKLIKRASGTGYVKVASGVMQTPSSSIPQADVTNLTSDLASKAPTASPTFTGTVTVPTPSNATDAASKGYVDSAVQGLSWKSAVRAATTANVTLSSALENGDTLDGVTLATGDRILVKDQSTASENGIYVVNASGAPTRATDADSSAELVNATVYVAEGTTNADRVFTQTANAPITVGTTGLTFAEVNGGTVPSANTTTQGKVELATQSEAEARSSSSLAVTPASLANFPYVSEHTIGDGSTTSIAITHNRGRKGVQYSVRQASDDAEVLCDAVFTSTSVLTLSFATAPTTNSLIVTIIG